MSEHIIAHTSTESTNNDDLIGEASAETVEPTQYEALSSELIDVASNRNIMQRDVMMKRFLSNLMADVAAGNVKNSKGEVYTEADIQLQLKTMFQSLTQPAEGENPLSFIPRSNGLRSAVESLLSSEVTAQPLMNALQERSTGIMNPERLTREKITEIGAEVVKSAGFVESLSENKEDPLEVLKRGLSTEDLMTLRAYANSKQDERTIHSDSRSGKPVAPGASQQAAQYAAAYLKEMSPAARAVAGQFDILYNKS